jgi:aminopeptidase N
MSHISFSRFFKLAIVSLSPLIVLSSCALFGIHFKVHNPKKPGKYPKFNEEIILLGENTPLKKNFNATFYDLDITIDPTNKSVGGWVEIRGTVLNDTDTLVFDLDQPLTIDELRWASRDGKQLSYNRRYRSVYVKPLSAVKGNTTLSLHVKYHGKPIVAPKPPWKGGFVWKEDKEKKHWAGVACESEGASIWFPCKDHTSDEPDSVRLKFTIPDTSLSVVSNGVYKGSETHGNSKSFKWFVSYPINMYNITFYIGNFARVEDSYYGISGKILALDYYVLKPNEEKARSHFAQLKNHLRAYEELYGEYSWYRDGFKLVESPYAGMEHQTAIAYGNGYKNDLNGTDDYIILHETGHEWFGNSVTAEDLADVWLQEGFTTYGEYLYLEKKYKKNVAANHLLFYRFTIKNKRPVVGPKERRYFSYKDGDVYVKGAWTLHTLRNTINNDSLFFDIIRTFYNENKLKIITTKAFTDLVNRKTGKDYGWLFDQYLYRRKAPFLEVQHAKDGTFYYRWTEVPKEFNKLPVYVKFPFDEETLELFPSDKIQLIKTSKAPVKSSDVFIDNFKVLFGIKWSKKLEREYKRINLKD